MTHTHKRPRKILGLKHEIISCAMFGENTFSEEADRGLSSLQFLEIVGEPSRKSTRSPAPPVLRASRKRGGGRLVRAD